MTTKIVPLYRIGRGSYGRVYAASVDYNVKAAIAIKVFDEEDTLSGRSENLVREVFGSAFCPARVSMRVSSENVHACSLVYKLYDVSLAEMPGTTSPAVLRDLWYPVLLALKDLHDQGLSHRDIKPANVLVDIARRHTVLCDYGLTGPSYVADTRLYTRWYRPPETFEGSVSTCKSDVFSLGLNILWQWTGEVQVYGNDDEKTYSTMQTYFREVFDKYLALKGFNVETETYAYEPPSTTARLAKLLFHMLQWDPSDRPSVDTLLADPFWSETPDPHELHAIESFWAHGAAYAEKDRRECKLRGLDHESDSALKLLFRACDDSSRVIPLQVRPPVQRPTSRLEEEKRHALLRGMHWVLYEDLMYPTRVFWTAVSLLDASCDPDYGPALALSMQNTHLVSKLSYFVFACLWIAAILQGPLLRGNSSSLVKRLYVACQRVAIFENDASLDMALLAAAVHEVIESTHGALPRVAHQLSTRWPEWTPEVLQAAKTSSTSP